MNDTENTEHNIEENGLFVEPQEELTKISWGILNQLTREELKNGN